MAQAAKASTHSAKDNRWKRDDVSVAIASEASPSVTAKPETLWMPANPEASAAIRETPLRASRNLAASGRRDIFD